MRIVVQLQSRSWVAPPEFGDSHLDYERYACCIYKMDASCVQLPLTIVPLLMRFHPNVHVRHPAS